MILTRDVYASYSQKGWWPRGRVWSRHAIRQEKRMHFQSYGPSAYREKPSWVQKLWLQVGETLHGGVAMHADDNEQLCLH